MDREIQQLVDMGATRAQARAALNKHKDVMQAAERIFDGAFDDVTDDNDDHEMASASGRAGSSARPLSAPPEGSDQEADDDGYGSEDGDDEDGYLDYDSDYDVKDKKENVGSTSDPYAGVFFSKDRREEVIEVEEESEEVHVPDVNEKAKLMTQGQWMKGCPEGSEQSFLFSLYRELSEGQCPCPHGCGSSIPRQKRDFFALFAEFSTYTTHLKKVAARRCPKCQKPFCFACGESMSEAEQSDADCLFHCSNLQGVILGVGLAMLEQSFMDEASSSSSGTPIKPAAGQRRKASGSPLPHGTVALEDPYAGNGKKAKLGIGYAGDVREDNSGQVEAQAVQKAKDEKISNLLIRIRVYLPNLNRDTGGKSCDYLPHPTTLAHLRRRFNYVSSQLLRNDSLVDMSDRSVLYFELLNWLETISCHEALASMMGMPIMVPASVKTVTSHKVHSRNSPQIRERTIVYEGSSGPRELLEAIVIQAQAAIKGLDPGIKDPSDPYCVSEMTEEQKRMTQDEKGKGKDTARPVSEENVKLFGFCRRILATARAIDRSLRDTKGDAFMDRLHASLPKIPGTSSGEESNMQVEVGQTDEELQKVYIEWANRVRFEYCDLSIPLPADAPAEETPQYKSFYSAEARMLANSDIPKRSLAIAKELAVLTTNLPIAWNSSIFLRVDETRVDVIKALITGPEGTPYYNGCYLFDIFLGPSYNQSPPSVKYMTTNGGKFRFNPNLYADGKVCLSLLGTWSGPGWIAGRSTLLQVLISIQSMILCEEPYINEPGWAGAAGSSQSKSYSANVRRMVVRTAMLGNLKAPPEPFADVIRTHFCLKGRSIMKQLDEWLEQDDGKALQADGGFVNPKASAAAATSSNGFAEDVAELKTLLRKVMGGGNVVEAARAST